MVSRNSGKVVPLRPDSATEQDQSRQLAREWFELHRQDLLRYARRILPAGESAEDLVQDVFYRILQQERLQDLRNPRAFLMTAARNAAIDCLRKSRTAPDLYLETELPAQSTLGEAQMIIAIERALEELPKRCKQVFVCSRFKGMDNSAIASAMGISPRMVQKHLSRAMAHFRDRLGLTNEKSEQ